MPLMQMSAPYYSADKRCTYVTMANGMRRRVEIDGSTIVIQYRQSKAEKKAEKRQRQRQPQRRLLEVV